MKWETYAKKREGMLYYQAVKALIEEHSPGDTIVDVGNGGTSVVTYGHFKRRIAINVSELKEREGVDVIVGRWPDVELPVEKADVVTCCQVIEHLENHLVRPFVDRLFHVAKTLIVSVPYQWSVNVDKSHKQDPIDDLKFLRLMGRLPNQSHIIKENNLRRLVAVFKTKV